MLKNILSKITGTSILRHLFLPNPALQHFIISRDFHKIAQYLRSIPRLISKAKKNIFTNADFASFIKDISDQRSDYDIIGEDKKGFQCAVCLLYKHSGNFRVEQLRTRNHILVCGSCIRRIKDKIDGEFRKHKGLPPKPKDNTEDLGYYINYHTQITKFIENKRRFFNRSKNKYSSNLEIRKKIIPPLPEYACQYMYSEPYNSIEAIESNPLAFNRIFKICNKDCDAIIEWFISQYGLFVFAFLTDIEIEFLNRFKILQIKGSNIAHFLYARIYQDTTLWNLYVSDFNLRRNQLLGCQICNKSQSILEIKHEFIRWSDGVILPLCNKHWNALMRTIYSTKITGKSIDAYLPNIKSILDYHTCPVCSQKHTWQNKTYTYAYAFHGIPPRFQEICSDCFNLAMNKDNREHSFEANLNNLLEISRFIGEHPSNDMAETVFFQCKDLDVATKVVNCMQEMRTFQKLEQKYRSWFAVLVHSGCLPEGTRKEGFGTRVLAKDGHVCLSLGEKQLDDLMHFYSIPHEKEIHYPDSNMRCDWLIQINEMELFVEYFGLLGNKEYDEKIQIKRELAIKNDLTLIEFYPFDFADIKDAFRKKSCK